jgi:integrase
MEDAGPVRKLLRFEDWPGVDRQAWQALFLGGDIFDDAGLARHWRPETRRSNFQHYARWLGWLAAQRRLDQGVAPPARVTPDCVAAYAAHLVEKLAPRTAASALIGLKVVMKVMAPDANWRWLMDITNRLNIWAKPSVDRSSAMRPVEVIHRAARTELDRLLATPLSRRIDRVAYRDTLIMLLLSCCPLRLLNLSGLRIGIHLRREGDRWLLRVDETETKNGQRLDHLLPRHIDPYLATYLDRVRASFRPGAGCDALWLGFEGQILASHSVYCRIILVTKRLLGTAINPHLFRSCAATSLVENAPEAARLAAPLLGHRYFTTTERYYVKAGQLVAGREVNAALAAIADELNNGDSKNGCHPSRLD